MKLLRYGPAGQEKPGLLDEEGRVRDLSAHMADIAGAALLPEGLAGLARLAPASLPVVPGVPQVDLRLGPCVGQVGKFICIGLNYADHAAESGLQVPPEPVIFNKWTSAIIGPDDDVELPRGSLKTDWEVELAVVIGKGGKYIAEADAMDHVAGFCIVNDVSEREYQIERAGTWDKGKGCDTFGPIGPWLVTRDEIKDPQNLGMWLDVNGVRRQTGNTSTMIFGVAKLVADTSQYMTLEPGDLITTGTPPGVALGMKPPKWLQVGDVVELGIDGLGTQKQKVVAYKARR